MRDAALHTSKTGTTQARIQALGPVKLGIFRKARILIRISEEWEKTDWSGTIPRNHDMTPECCMRNTEVYGGNDCFPQRKREYNPWKNQPPANES